MQQQNLNNARTPCHLTPPFQRTPANIRINLILPETAVPRLHVCALKCRFICICFLGYCFRKPRKRVLNLQERKQNLTWHSHSRSFKVTCLGISHQWKADEGLRIAKASEDIASESTENCRCRQSHCLSPMSRELSRIPHKPYSQKQVKLGYIFAVDNAGLSSFKFSCWAPKTYFWNRVRNRRSRSSKVVAFRH